MMSLAALPATRLSCTTTPSASVNSTPFAPDPVIVLPWTMVPVAGPAAATPHALPAMRFPSPADGPPTTRLAPAMAATPFAVLPAVAPARLRPIHEPRRVRPPPASTKMPLVQLVMLTPVITTPVWPAPACRPVPTDGAVQCSSTSGTPLVRVTVTVVPVDSMGSCSSGPRVIVPVTPAAKTMSSGPAACASMMAWRSEPAPLAAVVVTGIVAAEAPVGAIAAASSATTRDVRVMTRNATGCGSRARIR